METVEDLRNKIASHAVRLDSLTGADGKRIRKRVLANLGKLKKELADAEAREGSGTNKRARVEDSSPPAADVTTAPAADTTEAGIPKKQLKAKLHLLNKELADFAQKKQLKNAIKSFAKAQKKGIPVDVHSFANLINVYVRCGDIESAQKQFEEMKKLNVLPNSVLLTTLIKGYCENGNMVAAKEILDGMCGSAAPALFPHILYTQNSRPNIRTINTFFRGCIRVGDVNSALSYFERFRYSESNQLGVSPDKTTYEYVILLLCQALRYEEAKDILSKYSVCEDGPGSSSQAHSSDVSDSTSVYISMTRCALLVCEFEEAAKWLEVARTCLQFAQNAPLREAMLKNKDSHKASNASGRDSGRNVAMFLQHQQNEMENEMELFAHFIQSVRNCIHNHPEKPLQLSFTNYLISCMSKLLYFDYDSLSSPSTGFATVGSDSKATNHATNKHLVESLVEKFGLQRLLAVHKRLSALHSGGEDTDALGAQVLKKVMASVSRSDGCLQFEQVFHDLPPVSVSSGSTIHLEIGAGYGEWVIDQAWCAAPRIWEKQENSQTAKGEQSTGDVAVADTTEASKMIAKKHRKDRRRAVPVEVKRNIHVYDQELHADAVREMEEREKESAGVGGSVPGSSSAGGGNGVGAGRGGGHWISLELRCDRVYSTFTRNVLKRFTHSISSIHSSPSGPTVGASSAERIAAASTASEEAEMAGEMRNNLLILGGDANAILGAHFPKGRVGSIHINHPEPPERTGHFKDGAGSNRSGLVNCHDNSYWASGRHLLTKGFFGSMCDVLTSSGSITIVTDNKNYALQLAREIWLLNDSISGASASRLRCPFFKCSNFVLNVTGSTSSIHTPNVEEEEIFDEDEDEDEDNGSGGRGRARTEPAAMVAGGSGDAEDDNGSSRTLYRLIDSMGNVLDPQTVTSSSSCYTDMDYNIYIYQGEAPAVNKGGSGNAAFSADGSNSSNSDSNDNGSGNAVVASSYFDRMWNLGEMKRRWFVHVQKSV